MLCKLKGKGQKNIGKTHDQHLEACAEAFPPARQGTIQSPLPSRRKQFSWNVDCALQKNDLQK